MCGNDSDRVKVVIDLERYEQLVCAEEHYNNIVNAAVENMQLSSWRSTGYDIDMDDIKKYIMVVEQGRLNYNRKMLEKNKACEEARAAEGVTVREGEA